MLDRLHAVTFSAHLHSFFRIPSSCIAMQDLELVEVTERHVADDKQPWTTTRQERFSLLFRGGRDRPLQQGIYRMQHDQLGELELFLVPVGQDQSRVYYEAVFNRLRPADA
jgi:hypothetical protein